MLSEGIIYVREGVKAGVAPTEQLDEQGERTMGRGWDCMYAYVRVCGRGIKPSQIKPGQIHFMTFDIKWIPCGY